jgi:hypothetical protein
MSRITVATVNARVDSLVDAQARTLELLARVVGLVEGNPQFTTPATITEAVTNAPARKAAPAKATAKKAAPKAVETVSVEQAQALVDAGQSPWSIKVESSVTGKPIPFARVQFALRKQERVNDGTATDNKALAAEIRALGHNPTGRVWSAYKAGERGKAALAKLAKQDKAEAQARKASK